jgi:hypothetical protein
MQKTQPTTRQQIGPKLLRNGLLLLLSLPVGAYIYVRLKKQRHYHQLLQRQREVSAAYEPHFLFPSPTHHPIPAFSEQLAVIPNFLPDKLFQQLREEIVQHIQTERTYLPTHKQGGTVAYETLHETAPKVVSFYNSTYLRTLLSAVVGEAVQPTPVHDQSSCSLLFYTKPGDHINWHYDHNFYNGRHFTVLLPFVNQHNQEPVRLSSAQLLVKKGGYEQPVETTPNTLILFEGAKVLHKVTRLGPDETRIMLSMTFCTKPTASAPKAVARRLKDVAFFGPRALWT